MKIIFFIIILITFLQLANLKAEFTKISTYSFNFCDFVLENAKGVNYECIERLDVDFSIPQWRNLLEFNFGKLSKSEFDLLSSNYGQWHTYTPEYELSRNYRLLDFFPPIIQALNGNKFKVQKIDHKDVLPQFDSLTVHPEKLLANCWGTTYEILRHANEGFLDGIDVFYAPVDQIRDLFRERSTVAQHEKPGDIVLILHTLNNVEYLDHVVLVLDKGLYFEKAGAGDNVPYRIVDKSTLESIWSPKVFKYETREINSSVYWSEPSQTFSLRSEYTLGYFPTFNNLQQDISERFTAAWTFDESDTLTFLSYLWIKRTDQLVVQSDGDITLPPSAYSSRFYHLNK